MTPNERERVLAEAKDLNRFVYREPPDGRSGILYAEWFCNGVPHEASVEVREGENRDTARDTVVGHVRYFLLGMRAKA